MSRMIDNVVRAEHIDPVDPERGAFSVLALLNTYSRAMYVGNDLTHQLPTRAEAVRFCVCGLGARPPRGWESKFELSAAQAERSRRHSERVVARFMRTGA